MANIKTKVKKSGKGSSLHHFIATGGKPADYNKVNQTEKLRSSSKNTKQK